jgi:hypothetical protein
MYCFAIDEKKAECPLCGHEALVLDDYDNKERVVMCCDKYRPNWGGRYDE